MLCEIIYQAITQENSSTDTGLNRLMAPLMDSKFDIGLFSELPCPLFTSHRSQSPVIYLSSAPQFTLLSSHIQPSVCLVSSLILSRVMLVCVCWGWGVVGRMMIRAAGALFFWSHITVQQTCVRTAACALRCAQRPASIKKAIHLSGAVTPHTSSVPPTCLSDSWMCRLTRSVDLPNALQLRWISLHCLGIYYYYYIGLQCLEKQYWYVFC